jgi:hypothetical protein
MAARGKPVGVDRHGVRALRVSVGVPWLVCSECAVREAVVTAIDLPLEARLESGPAGGRRDGVVLLHTEHMRRQAEAVPRVLG